MPERNPEIFFGEKMRGKKPTTLNEEAERCAEKMGFFWVTNTLVELRFNGFIFRPSAIAAVKLIKTRYAIDDEVIIEHKFPDDVTDLRDLPLPASVIRELWIRTQNERAWRRFYILPETTAEIEFNTAENYRNTHFNEKKWRNAPFRVDLIITPKTRDEVE